MPQVRRICKPHELIFCVWLFVMACSGQRDTVSEEAAVLAGDSIVSIGQLASALADSNGLIVGQSQLSVTQQFGEVECHRIVYLSDGLRVVGFVVKPANIEGRLPVLIFNRGGNREFGKIGPPLLKYLSFLASNGYVVLASQYRGNDGGEGLEQFGGEDVNDVLNLVPLARSLPYADGENIVMLGYSRGGMMTYLAIKHGAPLQAAVVVSGLSDLLLTFRNRPEMKVMLENELVGTDRREYLERSAVCWPEKLTVPLLILHGSEDWRSNVAQATSLASQLDSLGYEYRLEVLEGGDHGLGTHKAQRNKLIFQWFASHLQ